MGLVEANTDAQLRTIPSRAAETQPLRQDWLERGVSEDTGLDRDPRSPKVTQRGPVRCACSYRQKLILLSGPSGVVRNTGQPRGSARGWGAHPFTRAPGPFMSNSVFWKTLSSVELKPSKAA